MYFYSVKSSVVTGDQCSVESKKYKKRYRDAVVFWHRPPPSPRPHRSQFYVPPRWNLQEMYFSLLTPHFYFPLELYVYIPLTNNYLAFFIYQLIILWTISINWHRWMLVNNHISKYNSFILVLYRRYIIYMSVCPPPPSPVFGTFLRHCNCGQSTNPLACFGLIERNETLSLRSQRAIYTNNID